MLELLLEIFENESTLTLRHSLKTFLKEKKGKMKLGQSK